MQLEAIRRFLLSSSTITVASVPRAIKRLERVYGEQMLAKILKCKTSLLRRCKDSNKVLLTETQMSKINTLIFIERLIYAEKSLKKKTTRSIR